MPARADISPWTGPQRRGLALAVLVVGAAFAAVAFRNRMYIPDPAPDLGPRAVLLDDRLDPNTASAVELAAIPYVGEKRAAAIVDWRTQFQHTHPNTPAFSTINDLARIKGVGPSTLALLREHLRFASSDASGKSD